MLNEPLQFRPFSLIHLAVLVMAALLVVGVVALRRLPWIAGDSSRGRGFDMGLGWTGLALAAGIASTKLIHPVLASALPLHICNLTMFIAPLALLTNRATLRALTCFWGLGVGSIALISPNLSAAVTDLPFWTFWVGHILIMTIALLDLLGRDFRPTWTDFLNVALISIATAAVIFTVDVCLNVNYGYLGNPGPPEANPAVVMGPWPLRTAVMLGLALLLMLGQMLVLQLGKLRGLSRENVAVMQGLPQQTG